jgi:hypothetical protein
LLAWAGATTPAADLKLNGCIGLHYHLVQIDFTLAAGQYRLRLVASSNDANDNLRSQGFAFSGQTPIALSQWNQT